MPTQRIPPLVIQQWGKVKAELVTTVKKAQGPGMTAEFKKDLTKKVETLFASFDSGLRAKLKKASEAKTDADAKKALQEVIVIAKDYRGKLKVAAQSWGTDGGTRAIYEVIDKNLKRIKDTAKTTLDAIG